MSNVTKICCKCGQEKPVSDFHKWKWSKDGYKPRCKDCRSIMSPEKKIEEEEKKRLLDSGLKKCPRCKEIRSIDEFPVTKIDGKTKLWGACKKCAYERTAIYVKNHTEETRAYHSNYCHINKDRLREKEAQRRRENEDYRQKANERVRQYYLTHKEKRREQSKRYNATHKEERRALAKAYRDRCNYLACERKKNDIGFKLKCNLRNRLWQALKLNNAVKQSRFDEYLGCSLEFFKRYLETKFKDGMNWDNYGRKGWHVDHIVPCAKFDLSKKEDQLKAFNYANLQPLWWYENLSKGDRITNE